MMFDKIHYREFISNAQSIPKIQLQTHSTKVRSEDAVFAKHMQETALGTNYKGIYQQT